MRRPSMFLAVCAALFLGALLARPAAAEQAISMQEVVRDSMTCAGITISTATSAAEKTQVIDDSAAGWTKVYIENEHATANIFCNERSDVATSGSPRGKKIAAGLAVEFTLTGRMKFYCISDSSSASNAMVCKRR